MINPFYTIQAFKEKRNQDIVPGKNILPPLPISPHKAKTIRPDADLSDWSCWTIHLTTDKQFYKPTETVYIMGYVTDHATHTLTTLPENKKAQKRRGKIVKKINDESNNDMTSDALIISSETTGFKLKKCISLKEGTFMVEWKIPEDQTGGEYTIKCEKYPCKYRKINIQNYIQPHFILDIKFDKEGYNENDLVSGRISTIENGNGEILAEKCEISSKINDEEINGEGEIKKGEIKFSLQLPKKINDENSISLTVKIWYNDIIGSTSKIIPIVNNELDIRVYVESSNYLISNVHNVVYFECFLKNGNPGDFEGEIIDKKENKKMMTVKTIHEGRGKSVPFIPESGKEYALHITRPVCKNNMIDLPEVTEGALIHSTHSSYNSSSIEIEIERSELLNKFYIGLYLKEIEIDYREVIFDKQLGLVSFNIIDHEMNLGGVFRVTLFTEDEIPIAERLIYVNPNHSINIDIKGDKNYYKPGETVELTIHTYNERILPIECNISVSVVDEGVLNLEEKRLQNPTLPLMIYVENEVDHLEDVDRYLTNDLKGNDEIDLLLGTQGWRRFIYKNVLDDLAKYKRIIGRCITEEVLVEEETSCDNDEVYRSDNKEEVVVGREYAYNPKDFKIRDDFRSTLFCSNNEKCNKKCTIRFQLSDSISSYRVRVEGFIFNDSIYGSKDIKIHSKLPFYIHCTPPLYVCDKDEIDLPVVCNLNPSLCKEKSIKLLLGSSDGLKCANCKYEWHQTKKSHKEVFIIGAKYLKGKKIINSGEEVKFDNENNHICECKIKLLAFSDDYNDCLEYPIRIYPKGYYYNISKNITVKDTSNEITLTLPKYISDNTMELNVNLEQSLSRKMLDSVHSLIRKPYGCFEQASSVVYPMILAIKLMKRKGGYTKKIEENSKEFISEGYKRLISYQTEDGGFEWFGNSPASEALTAYGLMEFEEMKEIYSVDEEITNKALDWLISSIDESTGYFSTSKDSQFSRMDKQYISAYIYWCLTTFNVDPNIKANYDNFYEKVKDTDDPYILSLLGLTCLNLKETDKRNETIKLLLTMQKEDGFIDGVKDSITHSKENALRIEVTSLCLLLWIKAKRNTTEINNAINKSVNCIRNCCSNGYYGSTQGTVLSLKALLEYDEMMKQNRKLMANNEMEIEMNNKSVTKVDFSELKDNPNVRIQNDSLDMMIENENVLNLKFKNGLENPMEMSYNLDFYSKEQPVMDEGNVKMELNLNEKELKEGDLLHMNLKIINTSDKYLGMVLSKIGIPGGCEVRFNLLRELRKEGKISFFELIDNYLVLYWKNLDAQEERDVNIELECKVPGIYEAEHCEIYEYYNDSSKYCIESSVVTIE